MLYKPKYCCNCGESIESIETLPLKSSGRFCDVCKTEFPVQEWLPTIFVMVFALFGLYGIGNQLIVGEPEPAVSLKQQHSLTAENPTKDDSLQNTTQNTARAAVQQTEKRIESNAAVTTNKIPVSAVKPPIEAPQTEKTYYCGATTKKGTPCLRKVKGGGRCWQHIDQ